MLSVILERGDAYKETNRYMLRWLENRGGELEERENLFEYPEERMQFVKDMLATGRLFDLIKVGKVYLVR